MKITTTRAALVLAIALAGLAAPAGAQSPTDSAFAVSKGDSSLFRVNRNGSAFFGGTYDSGASNGAPTSGPGTRMFWYPGKAALRAGQVDGTQWDDANIGLYSTALGQNVRALGDNAIAVGLRAVAANTGTVAMGEDVTATGAYSVVLGYKASSSTKQGAPRLGTFVFGDRSTTTDTAHAEVTNSALWRVANGFRIYTSSNLSTGVHVLAGMNGSYTWANCAAHASTAITTSTCAYLSSSGVWTNNSDVNRKHLFENVTGEDVLMRLRTMPITSWSYRNDREGVRHIGPMAQDFHAAFGLGQDDKTIGTVDADGVALAAAQALEARTATQAREIQRLQGENAAQGDRIQALERANAELQARVQRIEALLAGQDGSPRR